MNHPMQVRRMALDGVIASDGAFLKRPYKSTEHFFRTDKGVLPLPDDSRPSRDEYFSNIGTKPMLRSCESCSSEYVESTLSIQLGDLHAICPLCIQASTYSGPLALEYLKDAKYWLENSAGIFDGPLDESLLHLAKIGFPGGWHLSELETRLNKRGTDALWDVARAPKANWFSVTNLSPTAWLRRLFGETRLHACGEPFESTFGEAACLALRDSGRSHSHSQAKNIGNAVVLFPSITVQGISVFLELSGFEKVWLKAQPKSTFVVLEPGNTQTPWLSVLEEKLSNLDSS